MLRKIKFLLSVSIFLLVNNSYAASSSMEELVSYLLEERMEQNAIYFENSQEELMDFVIDVNYEIFKTEQSRILSKGYYEAINDRIKSFTNRTYVRSTTHNNSSDQKIIQLEENYGGSKSTRKKDSRGNLIVTNNKQETDIYYRKNAIDIYSIIYPPLHFRESVHENFQNALKHYRDRVIEKSTAKEKNEISQRAKTVETKVNKINDYVYQRNVGMHHMSNYVALLRSDADISTPNGKPVAHYYQTLDVSEHLKRVLEKYYYKGQALGDVWKEFVKGDGLNYDVTGVNKGVVKNTQVQGLKGQLGPTIENQIAKFNLFILGQKEQYRDVLSIKEPSELIKYLRSLNKPSFTYNAEEWGHILKTMVNPRYNWYVSDGDEEFMTRLFNDFTYTTQEKSDEILDIFMQFPNFWGQITQRVSNGVWFLNNGNRDTIAFALQRIWSKSSYGVASSQKAIALQEKTEFIPHITYKAHTSGGFVFDNYDFLYELSSVSSLKNNHLKVIQRIEVPPSPDCKPTKHNNPCMRWVKEELDPVEDVHPYLALSVCNESKMGNLVFIDNHEEKIQVMPAFIMAFLEKNNTSKNWEQAAEYAIDIGMTLSGVGNLGQLAKLRRLKNLAKLEKTKLILQGFDFFDSSLEIALQATDCFGHEGEACDQALDFLEVLNNSIMVLNIVTSPKMIDKIDKMSAAYKATRGTRILKYRLSEFSGISKKLDSFNDILKKEEFLKDFANVSDNVLRKLNANDGELINTWKKFGDYYGNHPLKKNINVLENAKKFCY